MVELVLPEEKVQFPRGTTLGQVAETLAPAAVAARVNGRLVDLTYPLVEDAEVEFITDGSPEGLEILRHSTAHVMAQAVKRLFPGTRFGIGPAIENGFYYDFDLPEPFSSDDLTRIEEEMKKIIEADLPFKRQELGKEEALEIFGGDVYKKELIEDLPDESVSIYSQGEFVDLCRGPHLPSTGYIKAFKLVNVAGAYWRGDSSRPMLQRIYGVAFPTQEELADHLHMLEEAAKRDHRRLGKELDLFSIHEEGPGFPFFHPKGMVLRNLLEDFWREVHIKRGYKEIKTPIILSEQLWRQSGHWDHYKDNMYFTTIDDATYAIKPMNCPGAMLVYKERLHSYREFPLRLAEMGLVHRHELSGVLHGLMRVRCFTQDDAHIFMLPSQIKDEISGIIDLVDYVYRQVFGFEYRVELSTRPENSMGSDEVWERATTALKEALEERGMEYTINEGDGAFYGPKIDFHLRDCLGRTWQCGTIQLDFLMPERFDLVYVGEDGERHRPVMIHRVVLGSIERFIGILIEHYAGAFPLWLAPVQVRVLTVGERHVEHASALEQKMSEAGIRVETDLRSEKVGYKIREAQVHQIPYMVVVGDKEVESGTLSIRHRRQGDLGAMSLEEFIERVENETRSKQGD
ncbi:MAG: threonine--tRNA ligase [Firmicutes bacterium]|nr:threonine--tRNA ligase [Bacillota bacterium]